LGANLLDGRPLDLRWDAARPVKRLKQADSGGQITGIGQS
jgi:hypothetical protein